MPSFYLMQTLQNTSLLLEVTQDIQTSVKGLGLHRKSIPCFAEAICLQDNYKSNHHSMAFLALHDVATGKMHSYALIVEIEEKCVQLPNDWEK